MTEPTSSEHDSSTIPLEEINRRKATAELRKLELEVEELERGHEWEARIARFVPIITALISIGGFILGVVIFSYQQAKEREAREQDRTSRELNDYRTGYEQLLLFSSNEKMTVARVLTLKQDLDALKKSLYLDDDQRKEEETRVMGSISNLIARDFDFTQPRQVTFDIAAMQNWREYQDGLISTLSADGTGETVNETIIDKYLQVVRDLQLKESEVFKNVDVDMGGVDPTIILKDPQRSVVNGFACHINLLPDNKKAEQAQKFGEITGAFKLEAFLKEKYQCPPIPAIPLRPRVSPTPARPSVSPSPNS